MLKFKVTKDEDKNVTVTADRIGFKKLPFLTDDENIDLRNEVFRIADICALDSVEKSIDKMINDDETGEKYSIALEKREILEKELGYNYNTDGFHMLAVVIAIGLGFCKADTKSPKAYSDIRELFHIECDNFYEKGEHKVADIRSLSVSLFNEIVGDFRDTSDDFTFKLDVKAWVIRWAIVNHRIVKARTNDKKQQTLEVRNATYKESFTLWCAMLCGAFGLVNLKDENSKKLYIG